MKVTNFDKENVIIIDFYVHPACNYTSANYRYTCDYLCFRLCRNYQDQIEACVEAEGLPMNNPYMLNRINEL